MPDGPELKGWLTHRDGGAIPCRLPLPVDVAPEDYASDLSKLRRYATCALLNIAPHENKERTAASDGAQPKTQGAKRAAEKDRTTARQTGAPKTRASRQAQPEPAAGSGDWEHSNSAEAKEIRQLLAKLPNARAAELRGKHDQDPKRLLAECRKATRIPQQTAGTASPRPVNERGTQAERIENGFKRLNMSKDDERALRTEYSGRPQDLLEHLKRLYDKQHNPR